MPDGFVPLATLLAAPPSGVQTEVEEEPKVVDQPAIPAEREEMLGAARRFHAALGDALDSAVQHLLPAIARDVVGRELRCAEADLAVIVRAALERFHSEKVLSVRVNPSDARALDGVDIPLIADPALEPGELWLELRSGTIDLTLETRLNEALAVWKA